MPAHRALQDILIKDIISISSSVLVQSSYYRLWSS